MSRSGKSTLIERLCRELDIRTVSEWNSDPLVKPLTDRLKTEQALSPVSFALVHLLDFDQRYRRDILPALERGEIVLCDRYLPTSVARDRCRGIDLAEVIAERYRTPDACVYVEPDFGLIRERFIAYPAKYGHYGLGRDLHPSGDDADSFIHYQREQHRHYVEALAGAEVLHWRVSEDPSAARLLERLRSTCPLPASRHSPSTA